MRKLRLLILVRIRENMSVERTDRSPQLPAGPAMTLLRSGSDAWLMYLREPGDSGFRTNGDDTRQGNASYRLSNGQLDEYPLAWCIDIEQCYQAIAYFCVNEGAKPKWVAWVPN